MAQATPAMTQTELEPRPPESGMGERIVILRGCASQLSSRQAVR